MLINVTDSQLATIVQSLEKTEYVSNEHFDEVQELVSHLLCRADFTEESRPGRKQLMVPEITDDDIKVLWEEYHNGFLSLDDYTDAMATVSKIVKASRQVESSAESACMMYNNLPARIRLLLNIS